MSRTQVLQLLPELDPGGAEGVVLMLARRLPRDRFEVSVAALDGSGQLAAAFREAGCRVWDLGGRSRVAPGAIRRLRSLVAHLQPDIVHSHLLRAHLAAGLAICCRKGPTVIMTEHQADPRRWALHLLRIAARKARVVTAVSEAVRGHLLDRGFASDRVLTLPNGIEVEAIAAGRPIERGRLGLPKDARLLLFVGRLTRQKGLDILLRAFSTIAAEQPQVHLLVAGDGEQGRELEHLSKWLGLAERVHFLGRRDDVAGLLKTAEVCVLPSRWEGLSLVLLEAMAAGRPVIATRVEGSREVLTDGCTGLLVEPESPAALAEALRRLLGDADLAARLGPAARKRVAGEFTAQAMAARYAKLYDEFGPAAAQ
ncbi:MAG: glycosyltransferase [Anaerolineaceae bacterium]|nr:glycosyltransferase [Anaerolineaceae bacterium]